MYKVYIATSREIGQKCIRWATNNMPEGFELVSDFDKCDIFISVLYDRLLSETEIASKKKCFNFHPGILPYHRGSGSYSWVIINNEQLAGVTLHEIDKSIDHGLIIEIKKFPVDPDSTAESLFKEAEYWIEFMFRDWFERLLTGNYPIQKQDERVAKLYYRKELEIARDLTKFVRAFTFHGKPKAFYYKKNGESVELEY